MRLEPAYVAAFLDCDGTVCVMREARKTKTMGIRYSHYIKAMFYSQNLEVLHDIKEIVGGEVTPPNEGLDVFSLQLSPRDTAAAMRILLPYLRIKREQALLALELQRHIDEKLATGRRRLSDEDIAVREAMRMKMQALNHSEPENFRSYRSNWVNSVKPSSEEATPSRAAVGTVPAEGVTAREVSPNNNPLQERPALSIVPRREEIA